MTNGQGAGGDRVAGDQLCSISGVVGKHQTLSGSDTGGRKTWDRVPYRKYSEDDIQATSNAWGKASFVRVRPSKPRASSNQFDVEIITGSKC